MTADESYDDRTQSFVALTAGTTVSHYKIIEKIGSGGMGDVYLALDTELNRKVALKFLPPHLCQDEDCRKRFKREAQAAAGLDHPNIAAIYEVGDFRGRPFYSMQVIQGQSLKDVIAGKDLPVERILEIAIQICGGLQAAHDKGIIHRDVKPSNILIDGHGRVRIVDFGLASIRGSEQLTRTGSTLGTIGYMSPEQVQGQETDHRSDLFSLGVVLYELITKQNPFKRDSEAATLKAVSDDTPEPLARFKTGLPDGLQAIIDKALEKDVKTRYQHADGMLSDLIRIKRSFESGTSTVSAATGAGRSARRLWGGAALIAVIAFAVLISTTPWLSETVSEKPEKIMLAVLAFENLGDPEDEYFADGITDEITARLMRVRRLGVIGSTSSMRYKGSEKPINEIGRELGSEYILTGTVRWQGTAAEGGRVRVTPRLINLADQSQVWADVYDESLEDIFAVQTAMANEVVIALDIALAATEEQLLSRRPTASFEAYQYYQRGREIWHEYVEGRKDLDRAIALMERAIELDRAFADAYAELSGIHSWFVETGIDKSDGRKELARQNAEMASRYDSLQAYSRVAWGYYYYYVVKDYTRALVEFEAARTMLPSNSETIAALGYVKRRLGQWEESFELQKLACELNPYNFWILYGVTNHADYMRSWEEMEKYADLELERFPDHAKSYQDKARFHLMKDGNAEAALEVIDRSPISESWHLLDIKWQCYYLQRDYDAAIEIVRQISPTMVIPADTSHYHFHLAELYRQVGDTAISKAHYDSARVIVERLQAADEDFASLTPPSLGQIYAGLGRKEDAISAARADTAAIPLSFDAIVGMERLEDLALTYIGVAEYDLALDVIDTLLSIPSVLSTAWIKKSPDFDPLRDHPRFEALLKKHENDDYGT